MMTLMQNTFGEIKSTSIVKLNLSLRLVIFVHLLYIVSLMILFYNFPDSLKMADIAPVHKKDETTTKDNYRPVGILPCISKIFERLISLQISKYMDSHLSEYLCGFRKGYST